jgi:hypothetical protein
MEACESVEKEVDRVIKKFTEIKEQSVKEISSIIELVESAKKTIDNHGKTKNFFELIQSCILSYPFVFRYNE